jgi:hypothetical protein
MRSAFGAIAFILFIASEIRASFRPLIITLAPSRDRVFAIANPIPDVEALERRSVKNNTDRH